MEIVKKVSSLALPIVISSFLNFLEPIINMVIVGQSSKIPEEISGLGLGVSYVICVHYSISIGISQGGQVKYAQSFGKKDYHMCGVYLWRARTLTPLLQFLLLPSLIYSESIFIFMGVKEKQAYYAGLYCRNAIYLVFVRSFTFLERFYLTSLQLNKAVTFIVAASILLHPFCVYYFVVSLDLGVAGVPHASSITMSLEVALIAVYKNYFSPASHPVRKTLIWPRKHELQIKDLWDLLVFGFYCFFMIAIVIVSFEFLIILAA